MIDPIQASPSSDAARLLAQSTTRASRARGAVGGASFAGQLARFVSADADASSKSGAVKAVSRPDNEQTTKVAGHPYSRIINGTDKGMYLNQVDGSPREGAVFKRVERDDRVFHVYGDGRDKVVVEIRSKAKADTGSAAAPSTGGATATTT